MHEIRPATLDDVDDIAAFQTEVWNETYRGMVPDEYLASTTAHTRQARWDQRIRSGDRQVFLGIDGGRLDGVASGGHSREVDYPSLIELMTLYVRASARRTGLGSQLLEATIGVRPAVLTVFTLNVRAIRFYEQHGFELDSRYSELDGDTGIMVSRMLRGLPGIEPRYSVGR